MSFGKPTLDAFTFSIRDTLNDKLYDAYIDLVEWISGGGQWGFDCRCRLAESPNSADWNFITGPDVNLSKITTAQDTDDEADRLIDVINAAISERFGGKAEIPDKGLERLRWIIKHGLTAVGNEVERV